MLVYFFIKGLKFANSRVILKAERRKGSLFCRKVSIFENGFSGFDNSMRAFCRKQQGSVMMEYIIITSVFMLGIGGLVYMDSKFVNMMPGLLPADGSNENKGGAHSAMTIAVDSATGYNTLEVVPESERKIESYGAVGNAFAALSQEAQKVIAMPQL